MDDESGEQKLADYDGRSVIGGLGGRIYPGELNGRQEASWRKTVELFGAEDDDSTPRQVALFPRDHAPLEPGVDELPIVRVKLSEMSLRRPRQWGACWLGCELWRQLGLDTFWREYLRPNREARVGISCCRPSRFTA